MAALGANRLLIGDHADDSDPGRMGSVLIYDLATGTAQPPIRNPNDADKASANFGEVLLAVDEHRFLVGAPSADAVYTAGGQLATNQNAGAVYLYDDTGSLLFTFTNPNPAGSGNFGSALAMLGAGRVLIGAPFDKLGTVAAGRVHLFNLAGVHLDAFDNPEVQLWDRFGNAIVALDERRICGRRAG